MKRNTAAQQSGTNAQMDDISPSPGFTPSNGTRMSYRHTAVIQGLDAQPECMWCYLASEVDAGVGQFTSRMFSSCIYIYSLLISSSLLFFLNTVDTACSLFRGFNPCVHTALSWPGFFAEDTTNKNVNKMMINRV